ncbi:Putative phosphatidate phosphatase [Papilio xuthus]|uniref:Putative phosphatidate phosphatase n=1 Tax=Papilio xuthus TaxID=66420 RepID=A0A194QE37_PAPXU|nr:Putative phosphatidate phosphatase [Papilio xuthus]
MAVDRLIWKIALDFFVLLCVAFPLLGFLLWAEPYHRGYFADDYSLRLPYKQQQISEGLLAGLGFAFIIVTVVITEFVRDKRGNSVGEKFVSGWLVPGWAWESYVTVGVYTFGAACQQLTVNAAKYVIGRLRPHFFDLCRPIPNSSSPLNELGYIQAYTCSGASAAQLKEMRLSFPSAHASFAMYTAVFFIVKGKWRGSKLLRHGCQFAALIAAWYVGLSRVVDHMHHWSDVTVGFIVGFAFGAIIFYIQVKGKWRGSKLLRHGCQFAALIAAWYVGLSRVVDHMHHWSDVTVGFIVGFAFGAIIFVYVLKPKKYGMPRSWETGPPEMLPQPVMSR